MNGISIATPRSSTFTLRPDVDLSSAEVEVAALEQLFVFPRHRQ